MRISDWSSDVCSSDLLAGILTDSDALRVTRILGLALVAISLVPLVGFGGQVSLCQMSFAAIGAVVMAHHGQDGDPLALLLAALVCALVGALVALPALRLSGLYLRSEEHTSELQSLMRISYAVFCLKTKTH